MRCKAPFRSYPQFVHCRRAALLLSVVLWWPHLSPAVSQQDPPAEVQAPAAPSFNPDDLPPVVAKIDGVEITREELLTEARGAYTQLGQMGVRRPLDAGFFREALDQILAGVLLSKEAETLGVAANDEEVAGRIAALKSRLQSEEQFQQIVANEGMTLEEYQRDLKRSMTIEKFIATQIAAGVTVSDEAKKTFYDQNLDKMRQQEMVRVRHILVAVKPESPPEEKEKARQKAQGLLERLEAGEEFATLAQEHSDDPGTKPTKGELPPFPRGQTLPAFEAVAFGLQPKERSQVFETPLGFHLLEVLDRQEEGIIPFEQVKDRLHQMLTQKAVEVEMRNRVEALRLKAQIEIYI